MLSAEVGESGKKLFVIIAIECAKIFLSKNAVYLNGLRCHFWRDVRGGIAVKRRSFPGSESATPPGLHEIRNKSVAYSVPRSLAGFFRGFGNVSVCTERRRARRIGLHGLKLRLKS
jgi:hypothetical protein